MAALEDIAPDAIAAAVSRAVVDAVAEGGEAEDIVARALDHARRALALDPPRPRRPSAPATSGAAAAPPAAPRAVVTEDDVLLAARNGSELRIVPGSLVTPLARDTAKDRGVRLVEG
jgi:hypothetical protein